MATARRKQEPEKAKQGPENLKAIKDELAKAVRQQLQESLNESITVPKEGLPDDEALRARLREFKGTKTALNIPDKQFKEIVEAFKKAVPTTNKPGSPDTPLSVEQIASSIREELSKTPEERLKATLDNVAKALETDKKAQEAPLDFINKQLSLENQLTSIASSNLSNEKKELENSLARQQAEQLGLVEPERDIEAQQQESANALAASRSVNTQAQALAESLTNGLADSSLVGPGPVSRLGFPILNASLQAKDKVLETLSGLNEKDIRFSPLGNLGTLAGGALNFLGGLFDLVIPGDQSGLGNIGDTIFGGRLPKAVQSRLAADIFFRFAPNARAEVADAFDRERLDLTVQQKAQLDGLQKSSGFIKDADDLKIVTATKIDLQNALIDNLPDFFGPEAEVLGTDLGGPIFNFMKAIGRQEQGIEDSAKIFSDIVNQQLNSFLINGGTLETFNAALDEAQSLIRQNFVIEKQKSLALGEPSKTASSLVALEVITANEVLEKMQQFREQASEAIKKRLPVLERIKKETAGLDDPQEQILKVLGALGNPFNKALNLQ